MHPSPLLLIMQPGKYVLQEDVENPDVIVPPTVEIVAELAVRQVLAIQVELPLTVLTKHYNPVAL